MVEYGRRKITKEQIEAARSANLADYFRTHGYDCEQRKDELHIKGYGGFYVNVNTNQWTCFSENKGGSNAVNCLTEMLGMDFKTAVKELAGSGISYTPHRENNSFSAQKKELVLPEKADNIIAILNSTTGSVLGLPLSLQYKSLTISYIFLKSTAASIFRSKCSFGTKSSMQIISL